MHPFSNVEVDDLQNTVANLICETVTSDPRIVGASVAIIHHGMVRHGMTRQEARLAQAEIFAWALRDNARAIVEASKLANEIEQVDPPADQKTAEAVSAKMGEIIKRCVE